ncbi:hypothetical protein GCM10011609_77520 [Lentzea pudingi]|uniref:Uncharacterized protein n=1 Tax=Lentzea pudingi TaxID=1789439 RepID=A0ABQ2ISW4_9PSEU|nr:hypothetical protein GCM10011609_77520 [Lentzea pudingi]
MVAADRTRDLVTGKHRVSFPAGFCPGGLVRKPLEQGPERPHAGAYDEMFSTDNGVRSAYRALYESVAPRRSMS